MKKSLAFSLPDNFLAAIYLFIITLLLPIGNASAGHPDGLIVFDQEIPKLGDIRIFSGSFIPFSGTWAECNGQMVSKEQYGKLFSIIGTTYGGNGNPNFALPKLAPLDGKIRYLICVSGDYPNKSNQSRQLNNRPTLNPSIKHDK
ncbi:MAG: tail fiber protein [Bacteroidetes bacterium]|nr:tail fiber protein [Bacteroidota bacterium]